MTLGPWTSSSRSNKGDRPIRKNALVRRFWVSVDVHAVPGLCGPIVTQFVTHPNLAFVWHPVDLATRRGVTASDGPSRQRRLRRSRRLACARGRIVGHLR